MAGKSIARKLLGFLFLCALVVGCRQDSEQFLPPEPGPSEIGSVAPLRLVVVDDELLAAAIQREWQAQGRDPLEVEVVVPAADLQDLGRSADILVFPAGRLGELVEANVIRPLPRHLAPGATALTAEAAEYRWNDVFPLSRREELRWGSLVYGVPFGSPQLILQMRRDHFPEGPFEAPRTWQEYKALLAQLKPQPAGGTGSAANVEAIAAEPLGPGWAARMLLARAAGYARHRSQYSALFQFATMEPLINQPPFVRALQDLIEVADYFPSDLDELTPTEVSRRLQNGQVAVAISWPNPAQDLEPNDSGPQSVLLAELPGSNEVYHLSEARWQPRDPEESPHVPTLAIDGRMGAVTTSSRQVTRASQLLLWLTAPEQSVRVTSSSFHTTMFRQSHLTQPEPWVGAAWAGSAADYAQILELTQRRSIWLMIPRIPAQADYLDALDQAVREAVREDAAPQQTLDEVAAAWSKITRERDLKQQKEAYLRSLGL